MVQITNDHVMEVTENSDRLPPNKGPTTFINLDLQLEPTCYKNHTSPPGPVNLTLQLETSEEVPQNLYLKTLGPVGSSGSSTGRDGVENSQQRVCSGAQSALGLPAAPGEESDNDSDDDDSNARLV